ncbi:uncharacterized protein LY89DRAFT_735582 [Mollisia scopiformis]|uniref:Uncharacterized protein n=1 Tax=Mollisia scopiformis TaxID=149040 RepID=A0A194X5M5_MOLSC|nr:uncharacterized protein LY89DRAFT_735582 [Mollisia scopiformis]KUJ15475.1 hypothetical protein LY89DRAFT_735582 [Mollisia scopiformis]
MSTATSPTAPRTLYITLQYLRRDASGNKYHWGLYATSDTPPRGTLFHATDAGRQPLDLYYEERKVENPTKSKSMTVCVKIGDVSSTTAIHRCVSTVPLMSRSRIPAGERQWTCRVYVKEALNALHNAQLLSLPASVGSIERACLAVADAYLPYRLSRERPGVYNDFSWLRRGSTSRTIPMEVDPTLYYPSEMEVDSSGRYRSTRSYGSLMDVDSSGRYASSQSYGF